MMNLETLRNQFIMEDDALKVRLEPLVTKALHFCKIDKAGQVLITNPKLASLDQVKLVLTARMIASALDPTIKEAVLATEIAKCTGLPANQVRARATDAIRAKFAESLGLGIYKAIPHRIEGFLDDLSSRYNGK